jgi:hypothetical protein
MLAFSFNDSPYIFNTAPRGLLTKHVKASLEAGDYDFSC